MTTDQVPGGVQVAPKKSGKREREGGECIKASHVKEVKRNGSTPSSVKARACEKKGSARSGLEVNWIKDKGNKETDETKKRRVHYGRKQPRIQTEVLGHSLVRSLVRSHRSLVGQ